MSGRPLHHHIRRNIVSYIALFFALTGTSVAAVSLANHSIDPVSLNGRYIGGYVRAWVSVAANGPVTASGGGVRVQRDFNIAPGHYIIDWRPRPTGKCTAIGSVDLNGGLVPGYMTAQAGYSRGRGEQSSVQVYNAQGQAAALPYDLELICATPR